MKFLRLTVLISILNIAFLLCFWYRHSSPIANSIGAFSNSDFLAAQANHNALLQVHLVILTILLAIVGIFGYNEIKKIAERTAKEGVEKALNELVPKLVSNQIEKMGPEHIAEILKGIQIATPLKKDERNLSDEIRLEEVLSGIEE